MSQDKDKSTPIVTFEKVCDACDSLLAKNGKFTIEDVNNALGGGSFTTITKYVQLYRQNRELTEQLDEMGSKTAIAILVKLDELISDRLADIRATAKRNMSEMKALLDEQDSELSAALEALAGAESQIVQLEAILENGNVEAAKISRDYDQFKTTAGYREEGLNQQIEQLNNRINLLNKDIADYQKAADRIRSEHTQELLRVVREKEQDKNAALELAKKEHGHAITTLRKESESKLQDLSAEHKQSLNKIDQALSKLQQNKAKVDALYQAAESRITAQKEQCDELIRINADASNQAATFMAKIQSLVEVNQQLHAEVARVKQELADTQKAKASERPSKGQ